MEAQIVHNDNVEIEKSDGAKLDLTHTGNNRTWQLVSGLYSGFQIGYLTGNLTGTNAPFFIGETGRVGIGTTTPDANALMTVAGNLSLSGDLRMGSDPNVFMNNGNRFLHYSPSSRNFSLGWEAGNATMSGQRNMFIGFLSGNNNASGQYNTMLGYIAGQNNTSGSFNSFFGYSAGNQNTTGSQNMFVGHQSGYNNVDGSNNMYLGRSSGFSNNGDFNTFIGSESGKLATATSSNVLIGYQAGSQNNSSTGQNTYIGTKAGAVVANASQNVGIGYMAGYDSEGTRNVFIGHKAGLGITTTESNRLYIGNDAYNQPGGALIYGEFDNGKVGVNTDNLDANATLTVGGQISATGYLLNGLPLASSPWAVNSSDISFQSGNVGIGTGTPLATLHVLGTNTQKQIRLERTGTNAGVSGDIGGFDGNLMFFPGGFESKDGNAIFDTSGDIGIGITSPQSKLHVKEGNQHIRLLTGTNSSGYMLDIGVNDDGVNFINTSSGRGFNFGNAARPLMSIAADGKVDIGGDVTKAVLRMEATDETGAPASAVGLELHGYEGRAKGIYISDKNYSDKWFIGEGYNYQGIGIGYHATSQTEYAVNAKFFINKDGEVGIGTTSPTAKLDVNGNVVVQGKIESTKVKVSTMPQGNWPDYVFEPEFKLRSLSEVEAFVKDNKHLPEVPSAKEVEANGIDLGNMDATLLKKVEEVTLYLIEMNKKIEKLEEENKKLKELLKKDK
ncbi:MAG: hypothetical protein Roseis2KO_49030 [Roseivirga sp.]